MSAQLVRRSLQPVGRCFFGLSTKQGDVFPYFSSLTCWLLKQLYPQLEEWSEFDDLNQICNAILRYLKMLHFEDPMVNLVKLRQMTPEVVCLVLDFLTTQVLVHRGFHVQSASYAASAYAEEAQVDALVEEKDEVEEDVIQDDALVDDPLAKTLLLGGSSSTSTSTSSSIGGAGAGGRFAMSSYASSSSSSLTSASSAASADLTKPRVRSQADRELIVSNTKPEQWALHLESMLPKLQVKLESTSKEWRARLDQCNQHKAYLAAGLPDTVGLLDKLGKTMKQATERLKTREQHINAEFAAGIGSQVKESRLLLQRLRQEHARLTTSVTDLNEQFTTQSAKVAELRAQMTDRNSTMTDVTPLRKLQASLQQVKKDVDGMELQIGVLSQMLLHAHAKASANKTREEAASRVASGGKVATNLSLSKRL